MKRIIYGCESRGDGDKPYLIRWTIFKFNWLKCYFHKFVRSDADELHDHPWAFISIILWRGYVEETFVKPPSDIENNAIERVWDDHFGIIAVKKLYSRKYFFKKKNLQDFPTKKKRIYPGMIIFRKASHAHRVELLSNKPAYTLMFTFKYVRQWGFYTHGFWHQWQNYFKERGC